MRRPGIPILLSTVLLALPGETQEQRGAIEGRVLDRQGSPVAGVTVSATSKNGLTVRVKSTEDGVYRFPTLPPGTWSLEARLKDLRLSSVEGIELLLGRRLTIDLEIGELSLSEAVEVKAEAPLLDTKESAQTWNLREDDIDKLPRGRTFFGLVTLAPGANREPRQWGLSIDGSSSTENVHVIDGVETTDPVDGGGFLAYVYGGTRQTLTLTDFIEELEVKTAGYAAEYGGSTGGVINVVTQTGTNSWQGDVALYLNDDGLDGPDRPFLFSDPEDISRATYSSYPKDDYERWEPGFTVGGPLAVDKSWLFAGYFPAFLTTTRAATFLDGVTRTGESKTHNDNVTANVTHQLSDRTRLRLAYNHQGEKIEGLLPFHEFASPEINYDIKTFSTSDILSAVLDFVPTNELFVSVRGGWFRSNYHTSGAFEGNSFAFVTPNIGLEGVPEDLQHPATFSTPGNFEIDRDIHKRLSLRLDSTYFLADALGQHQLKAGIQWTRVGQDVLAGSSGNYFVFFWDQSFEGQRGPFGYYQVFGNDVLPDRGDIGQGDVASDNLGLFVQDSWTIKNRLTLNVGLRTETDGLPSYSPDPRIPKTALEFGFGDKLAPRLGFAWDVRGDGEWKAYGNWGLYYDVTKLSLAGFYFGAYQGTLQWYTLDTPDWPNLDTPGCPPDCPGELILGPIDLSFLANDPEANLIDPDIQPMRLQEWSLGVERELTPKLSAGLRYLHKQVDVALEDIGAVDDTGNEILVIGNPGRGRSSLAHVYPDGATVANPQPERNYDALEFTIEKRMASRWSGRASYVWSRLEGNYSGLSDSEFLSAGIPNLNVHFDHPFIQFDETGQPSFGPLATDRPHQIKLQAVYDFSFGASVGLHWFGLSGIPRTRQADFFPFVPLQYLGRSSDGRMGFLHQANLYVQHQLRVTDRMRLTMSVNVLNLFDQSKATDYYPYELFHGQGVFIDGDDFYRGFDTQQLIEEQGLVRDASFLRDTSFQLPREIRLGLNFTF